MKKVICVLAGLAVLCSGLFAESIKKEIDIKDIAVFLASDEFYYADSCTLQIKDNFKPEDVTVSEIEAFSYFMHSDPDNKIEGPIEYIYFDGTHSAEVLYRIRQKIDNAKEKFVCIDFSNSDYYSYYPLPKNIFAGHENLYWVYFGSFVGRDVPANTCKDCKNLQFVMMWNYGKVDDTAFSGVNESAKLYDREDNESPLDLIHKVEAEEYDNWDYLAFANEPYFDEEVDDDYASYDQMFEDLVNSFYEKSMEKFQMRSVLKGYRFLLLTQNGSLSNITLDKTSAYSTAIEFLCNYLLGDEKTDLENSLNERYTSVFDLNDLVFHICKEGEEFATRIADIVMDDMKKQSSKENPNE